MLSPPFVPVCLAQNLSKSLLTSASDKNRAGPGERSWFCSFPCTSVPYLAEGLCCVGMAAQVSEKRVGIFLGTSCLRCSVVSLREM